MSLIIEKNWKTPLHYAEKRDDKMTRLLIEGVPQ